jgi:hypothetical protein
MWRWRAIESLAMQVDMGALYGGAWADLSEVTPSSQFVAEGSPVSVDLWGRVS